MSRLSKPGGSDIKQMLPLSLLFEPSSVNNSSGRCRRSISPENMLSLKRRSSRLSGRHVRFSEPSKVFRLMNRLRNVRGSDVRVIVPFSWFFFFFFFFYSAILKLHVPFDTYAHALCFSGYACGLISSRGLKQQRISRCLPSSRHQGDSPLGSNLAVS